MNTAGAESREIAIPESPRALLSGSLDFWLVGGFCLALWIALLLINAFVTREPLLLRFWTFPGAAGAVALLINYPHFMASYKIGYSRGPSFILAHWLEMIAVPLTLAILFAICFQTYSSPNPVPSKWNPFKLGAGEMLFSAMTCLMFAMSGWHYAKQVYGCMLMSASFHKYHLSQSQRRLLLTTLWTVVVVIFVGGQTGETTKSYLWGVPIISLGLPRELYLFTYGVFWFFLVLVAYFCLWKNWREQHRLPPLNFIIPLVAIILWWLNGLFFEPVYFYTMAPVLHSIQYLPFVARYERERNRDLNKKPWSGVWQALFLIIAGLLTFELIPRIADAYVIDPVMKRAVFFAAAAQVFINMHHYYIDSVIWRFHLPDVRRYLLGHRSGNGRV